MAKDESQLNDTRPNTSQHEMNKIKSRKSSQFERNHAQQNDLQTERKDLQFRAEIPPDIKIQPLSEIGCLNSSESLRAAKNMTNQVSHSLSNGASIDELNEDKSPKRKREGNSTDEDRPTKRKKYELLTDKTEEDQKCKEATDKDGPVRRVERVRRKKHKINCEHVDFVKELGYKQNMQLILSNVFVSLTDKEIAVAFCVSKRWNKVLGQNSYIRNRRDSYVKAQIKYKRKHGFENWPVKKKNFTTNNRRAFGEMTNRGTPINR